MFLFVQPPVEDPYIQYSTYPGRAAGSLERSLGHLVPLVTAVGDPILQHIPRPISSLLLGEKTGASGSPCDSCLKVHKNENFLAPILNFVLFHF